MAFEIVDTPGGSDGDPTHKPEGSQHRLVDPPTLYLEKIGTGWMKHLGRDEPGK
jgi:hypothetical protein